MSSVISDMQDQLKVLTDTNNKLINQNNIMAKKIEKLQSVPNKEQPRKRLTSTPNILPESPVFFLTDYYHCITLMCFLQSTTLV